MPTDRGVQMRSRLAAISLTAVTVLVGSVMFGGSSLAGDRGGSAANQDPSPRSLDTWKTYSTPKDGGTTISVSAHGNVFSFNSPTGSEHIQVGAVMEGYILCYNPGGTIAYDVGARESGFGPSTTGANNVMRTTSDGVVSLNQVFTFSQLNRALQVAMTITNLSAAPITGVTLTRKVDFDIDGDWADDWHMWTQDAYSALDSHGMVLKHVSQSSGVVHYAMTWQAALADPQDCSAPINNRPVQGDYSGAIIYTTATINAGKSKTVKVSYERN